METMPSSGGGMVGYSDSVESSPRSRGGESWDEPFPSSAAAASSKLRLMCSYGGRIVPRPTDKSLCYLGGETRIVVVERHCSLADLHARLARTIPIGGRPFLLKYQLPAEDLDSLISVTTDEDLDNMVEEYDRLLQSPSSTNSNAANSHAATGSTARSSRLRLFIFPSKPESATSSIDSLLDDSKSESWFVDALNGAMAAGEIPRGLSADSASVNCLLGLEDDSSVHSRASASARPPAPAEPEHITLPRPDSSGRLASVPDSMLETASSYGSASSVPSLSNLPPIRVRPDDRRHDPRLEDHFAHMNISSAATSATMAAGQRPEDGFKEPSYVPHQQPPPPTIPQPSTTASTATISPTDNPNKGFSSDDEKSEHGGARKPPQAKPSSTEAIPRQPVYYQERVPPATAAGNPITELKREYPVPIQVPDQSYMLPQMQQGQLQQQQFIQANPPHFVHQQAASTVVQMPCYYPVSAHPMQHSQQPNLFDRQFPMYYVPVQQNPAAAYNLGVQPTLGDANAVPPAARSAVAVANSALPTRGGARTVAAAIPPSAGQPQLFHVPADHAHAYPGMGYHHLMHQHPSQTTAAAVPANYGYEFADPSHPQMYYAQSASPPAMAPQYQAMSSAASNPEPMPADVKQTRAS